MPLPPFLRDELGQYLALSRRNTDDLVFSAPEGGPLRHGLFYRRAFNPAVLAAGLPEGGHLFPERDAEITDRLEDLFRRVSSPGTRTTLWLR